MANPIDSNSTDQRSRDQLVKMQVNKYIDDSVRRFLPTGTNYIIVDEDLNVISPGREDI